jgi:secreted Zn-dependent insulinase-like peptidase
VRVLLQRVVFPFKSTSGSPWQQFGTGNFKTLHDLPIAAGEVLHYLSFFQQFNSLLVKSAPFINSSLSQPQIISDHLVRFHQTHYVAPNMRLVVLCSAPIHHMSEWVSRYFSDVPQSYPGITLARPRDPPSAESIASNFDSNWFKL